MTDLITIMGIEDPDPVFERGSSTILFELIEDETWCWTFWDNELGKYRPVGMQIESIDYDHGDASIEQEAGMLTDVLYDLLDSESVRPGWWVMEGFTAHYIRGDGWETDDTADYNHEGVRPARWSDIKSFGMMPVPMWARFALWIGLDPLV